MKQAYRIIQKYSLNREVLPKSTFGYAIKYVLGEANGILHTLKSGEYSLDNNAIEREFKRIIVGRKNYLFCQGHAAAERAASIYSLIGTCKLNNIDPDEYIEDVLRRINDCKIQDLVKLLPQNWTPDNSIKFVYW